MFLLPITLLIIAGVAACGGDSGQYTDAAAADPLPPHWHSHRHPLCHLCLHTTARTKGAVAGGCRQVPPTGVLQVGLWIAAVLQEGHWAAVWPCSPL